MGRHVGRMRRLITASELEGRIQSAPDASLFGAAGVVIGVLDMNVGWRRARRVDSGWASRCATALQRQGPVQRTALPLLAGDGG